MLKRLAVFLISFLITTVIFSVINFAVAGAFSLVVLLFSIRESFIVFKWLYTILLLVETVILVPYLIKLIKEEERNETSGT